MDKVKVMTWQTFNKSRGGFRDKSKTHWQVFRQYGYVQALTQERGEGAPLKLVSEYINRLSAEFKESDGREIESCVYRTIYDAYKLPRYEVWFRFKEESKQAALDAAGSEG